MITKLNITLMSLIKTQQLLCNNGTNILEERMTFVLSSVAL